MAEYLVGVISFDASMKYSPLLQMFVALVSHILFRADNVDSNVSLTWRSLGPWESIHWCAHSFHTEEFLGYNIKQLMKRSNTVSGKEPDLSPCPTSFLLSSLSLSHHTSF